MRLLKWSFLLLIIAIILGIFGFSGAAGIATTAAMVLFFVSLLGFVVMLVIGLALWRRVTR